MVTFKSVFYFIIAFIPFIILFLSAIFLSVYFKSGCQVTATQCNEEGRCGMVITEGPLCEYRLMIGLIVFPLFAIKLGLSCWWCSYFLRLSTREKIENVVNKV